MALYTFESPFSIPRVTDKFTIVDSSYFIVLNARSHRFKSAVTPFHRQLQTTTDTTFHVNVIVRLECIRQIRKGYLQACLFDFQQANPGTDALYRQMAIDASPTASIEEIINRKFDTFYKYHVRNGDIDAVLSTNSADLWDEQLTAERLLDLEYFSGSTPDYWIALGTLFNETLMDPTDAMIANAALFHTMDAILTCDCDYAKVADEIDVYMPASVAQSCTGIYDQSVDNRA